MSTGRNVKSEICRLALNSKSERPDGWEARLGAVLRDATRRQFDARSWNCAHFAHACAVAVSGHRLRGPCSTTWKGSLEASADAMFARVEPLQARRGDVVMAYVPEPSLGVCVGSAAAFVTTTGLLTRPLREVRAAWRV